MTRAIIEAIQGPRSEQDRRLREVLIVDPTIMVVPLAINNRAKSRDRSGDASNQEKHRIPCNS